MEGVPAHRRRGRRRHRHPPIRVPDDGGAGCVGFHPVRDRLPIRRLSFVPILALQGVLFGRVAGYLEPRFRYLADVGAFVLFAVAAATTGVVLQSPGATAFTQAWSLGSGILLGAALVGYVLIALGMTAHLAPATLRLPMWPRQRPRGSSTERSLQVFR